jgi:hypothetical protein
LLDGCDIENETLSLAFLTVQRLKARKAP